MRRKHENSGSIRFGVYLSMHRDSSERDYCRSSRIATTRYKARFRLIPLNNTMFVVVAECRRGCSIIFIRVRLKKITVQRGWYFLFLSIRRRQIPGSDPLKILYNHEREMGKCNMFQSIINLCIISLYVVDSTVSGQIISWPRNWGWAFFGKIIYWVEPV